MKKVFNIIISVCLVATIGLVAFNFLSKLEAGNKIYNHAYNYTQNLNSKSLAIEIKDCSTLSKSVLNGTTLTQQQLSYLDGLADSINKLDSFEYSLSLNLISYNKKSAKTSKIIKSIKDLTDLRDELLFDLDVYTVKMTGNTIGDPIGTYSDIVNKVLQFVKAYNSSFKLLKNYIVSEDYNYNETKINIFDIYTNALQNMYDNYDKETLFFNNKSFDTVTTLNSSFVLENNNLQTAVIGGIYSSTASNFNNYYSKIDKQDFIKNFYLKSYNNINIDTEKQLDNITYYYLMTLVGVN